MLTIYSGYHLANKKENITLDIRELQPQQKIIEIVTDFVTASEALEDDLLDVGINTTNPLVIVVDWLLTILTLTVMIAIDKIL